MTKLISLILPVYNESPNIKPLYQRLKKCFPLKNYEFVFINDGSKDDTFLKLQKLHQQDKRIKIINFSRNFGHQIAVTAGLQYASGQIVAILDADLQDPPEVLPKFFEKNNQGYDVVYAIRKKRKENFIKKFCYSSFYRLLHSLANINIPLDSGDFCVLSRQAVNAINSLPERNRFVRGIRSWVGFKQIGISYERQKRHAGDSKYPFKKLLKLAFDGIFSFSYAPLKLMLSFGTAMLIISILGSIIAVYIRFFTHIFVPGFATTVILISFFGGLQMFTLGLMGEYIGRIYDEVKQRPNFIIHSTIGFDKK